MLIFEKIKSNKCKLCRNLNLEPISISHLGETCRDVIRTGGAMHTGGGAHCGKIGREASDKILPRSILNP